MKFLLIFLFVSVSFWLQSCSSSKKAVQARKTWIDTLPALPNSEIDLPIKVFATPILAKAEQVVPKEFTSDSWPNYIQPSCDFRYKYRFVRSGLTVSCLHGKIGVQFTGNYQVAGSRCLCSVDRPITPWISGSCGFGTEPMRKITISLSSQLHFMPSYQIRTQTSLAHLQALDRCQVSLFSSDVTQMVVDSVKSSVLSFCSSLDETIAGLSFSSALDMARRFSYKKTDLGNYGFVSVNPLAIRIGQLDYSKDSFAISVGLTCRPLLTSDSSSPAGPLAPLPPLQQLENHSGISLYLNALYDYDFISKVLNDSLHNRVFDVKGRTIVVKNVSVRGMGQGQVEVKVDFEGSNKGSITLHGTPKLDTAKQTLSVVDLSYSLESQDLVLKMARSLFRNKIRKTLEGKSYLDVGALIRGSLPAISSQFNRKLTSNLYAIGKPRDIRLIGLLAGEHNLQAQLYFAADLSIISNGNY